MLSTLFFNQRFIQQICIPSLNYIMALHGRAIHLYCIAVHAPLFIIPSLWDWCFSLSLRSQSHAPCSVCVAFAQIIHSCLIFPFSTLVPDCSSLSSQNIQQILQLRGVSIPVMLYYSKFRFLLLPCWHRVGQRQGYTCTHTLTSVQCKRQNSQIGLLLRICGPNSSQFLPGKFYQYCKQQRE